VFLAHVTVRGSTHGGLEGIHEMEAAQTRDRRQLIDPNIVLQVRLYVVQHACQSASIEPFRPLRRWDRPQAGSRAASQPTTPNLPPLSLSW
jgi:hypothetical protein